MDDNVQTTLLQKRLDAFTKEAGIHGKGPLSLVLVLTRSAKEKSPPYTQKDFLTAKGGQVKGLGGPAVQSILADHDIGRMLASEGGRTSRGSIARMKQYIDFLNSLHEERLLHLDIIESWWISRVKDFFAAQPLKVKNDASKSLRHIIAELIKAAFERQAECAGLMVAGAVIQHLVGAKLSVLFPEMSIEHHGFSVADSPGKRKGDFLLHDTAIHVTTSPSENLIRKCEENLDDNIRPIIVTLENAVGAAKVLANNFGIADRLEVLEIEQFIATNVYEWSRFSNQSRPISLEQLINAYNDIITDCESDPSLKITIG